VTSRAEVQHDRTVSGEEPLGVSCLIFHVIAENAPRQVNFTLTVSGDAMTGTACGETCATLKLKKPAF
jgi:hypothetical protein